MARISSAGVFARRRGAPWVAVAVISTMAATGLTAPLASGAVLGASPSASFAPTTNLRSGEHVTVKVTGEADHATLLALECSSEHISDGEDDCENRQNGLFFVTSKSGEASYELPVVSTIDTALGTFSCSNGCLVAVVHLTDGNGDTVVGFSALSFAKGSKPLPAGHGPPAPPAWSNPAGLPAGTKVTPATPDKMTLTADPAPTDLSDTGAVTGPSVSLPAGSAPGEPERGVALLQLVLAAPKTSWASGAHTAVVADVTVGDAPPQQIVLFAGSRAFTYAAVFGTIATGSEPVTVAVDKRLSTTGKGLSPALDVIAVRLSVVTQSNPSYLEMAYAPVVYGRPDTAESDTPLLSYATEGLDTASSAPAGTEELSYTTIWSKEDAGTSFVPWLEWGEWGRMTDITETISLDVSPSGKISDAEYDSCGCSSGYGINRTSPAEEMEPFKGHRYGTHLIVRNASGNDYQSDDGTSAFRLEQAPVAGPAPGAQRETVMDANGWTYRLSGEELSRWYSDGSSSATSPAIGDSRQYAIVSLETTTAHCAAVAVAIRLKGSATWYRNDFASRYSLYDGGSGRTAVKLPLGWVTRGIAAVRLVAYPSGSAKASVKDISLHVLGLTAGFSLKELPAPAPVVMTA